MKIFALAVLAASAGVASAAVTVSQWDLTGTPGDQAFTAGSGVANVTADNLTRGAGLTANTGGNSLNSSGWSQQATDYVSLGFTVAGGYGNDRLAMRPGFQQHDPEGVAAGRQQEELGPTQYGVLVAVGQYSERADSRAVLR